VAPSPPIASADALRRPGIHLVLSTGDRWPGAAHLLTTAERARADAFRHEQSRGEFVVGRALVRRLVAAATGLPAREIPIKQMMGKAPTENSKGVRLPNLPQVRDIMNEEYENMLAGKQTAQQALDNAVTRGNAAIKEAGQ